MAAREAQAALEAAGQLELDLAPCASGRRCFSASASALTALRCGRGWPSWPGAGSEGAAQPEHPEWIASDVCGVLGILNPRQALSEFTADEKGVTSVDTPGGPQDMLTVTMRAAP